ncbi:HMG-Y-related protein [Drosera capensis]
MKSANTLDWTRVKIMSILSRKINKKFLLLRVWIQLEQAGRWCGFNFLSLFFVSLIRSSAEIGQQLSMLSGPTADTGTRTLMLNGPTLLCNPPSLITSMDPLPQPPAADHHHLPAANPISTHLTIPSHPPYAEMIITAITVLNSKKGSSKKAIAKFVTQAYGDRHLPPAHLGLLTHHLKRLKNSGELIMVKKSYKINRGARFGGGNPKEVIVGKVPRKRGRPRKNAVGVVGNVGFGDGLVKRRPGRPRKEKVENGSESVALSIVPTDNGVGVGNGNVVPVVKRGRGRPPKKRVDDGGGGGGSGGVGLELVGPVVDTLVRRGRGRPRKDLNEVSYLKPVATISRRGRPPLMGKVGAKRRGRPPLIRKVGAKRQGRPPKCRVDDCGGGGGSGGVGLELVGPVVETLVRKGRGRGRGRPWKDPNEVSYLKSVAAIKKRGRPFLIGKVGPKRRGRPPLIRKVGAKQRGRPPKNATAVLVPGRQPVGRPKKNAPVIRNPLVVQADELTRKLEFMQACIKSAVTALQPHVNQNAADAVSALHRLEELTTMSINPAPEFTAHARLLPVAISVPLPINTVYH